MRCRALAKAAAATGGAGALGGGGAGGGGGGGLGLGQGVGQGGGGKRLGVREGFAGEAEAGGETEARGAGSAGGAPDQVDQVPWAEQDLRTALLGRLQKQFGGEHMGEESLAAAAKLVVPL